MASGRNQTARSSRSANQAVARSARRWWRGTLHRCGAPRDPRGPDEETQSGTTRPVGLQWRRAGAEPGSAPIPRIDAWSRNLEVVAQALVGFLQEITHPVEVPLMKRVHKSVHTLDLGIDVPAPLRITRLGLVPALVVRGRRERTMLA